MKARERALCALCTQAQFEIAKSALEVAQAASRSAQAEKQVTHCEQSVTAIATELQGTMQHKALDPAWLSSMQRLYRGERRALVELQTRLATAQQREQQARGALAQLRNRERSLERAVRSERQRQQRERDAREGLRIDELWLQHSYVASLEDGRAREYQTMPEHAFAAARAREQAATLRHIYSETRASRREPAAMRRPV